MRKSLRLMVAAATGAVLFATGGIVAASPAFAAGSVSATGTDFADLFIPPSGSDKITFKIKATDVYAAPDKPGKIHVQFLKPDEAESGTPHAGTAADIPTSTATPAPTGDVTVAASIPLSASDKPGTWKYRTAFTANGVTAAPTFTNPWQSITVATATRVTSANVDPDPVVLKKSEEVDVFANFKLEKYGDEKVTNVRYEHSSGDYYTLPTGLEADDSYHGSASFDYQAPAGSWQLKVTVTRGSKTYSFVKGFSVKGASAAAKAKSKITIAVSPAKVKKGKTVKIYGTVYRGTSKWGAWSKKILKLYFKKKGTKTWKFVGYVGANSTGKYSKTVKPKYDGYWRLQATSTSATNSSLSPYKLVDVR
ncbi:hypothetical protein GT755_21120 [Herbidospora sp. NEAU-GS84]|uniref:Uncharacterized protein n=1 Tax=Herbidospora solisilvae TaxID=2696284 RepID=A0A7C9JGF5_9ACTN|nr:hypothetical protein [Herbidospora solisilvae]NAS24183.1 hypothetical protein [Herbidospora solisilvae]